MLSPEEQSLLENAKSLIEEIESMQAGEASLEPDEEEVAMQMDEEKKKEYDETEKSSEAGVQKQESEGSTASDDSEERVEDLPEQTEENVDEVAKAIVALLGKAPVNKSLVKKARARRPAASNNKAVAVALNALTNVVKTLAVNQNEQDAALTNILDGLGITEAVKAGVEKSEQKPVVAPDLAGVLSEVNKSLKELKARPQEPEQRNDRTEVRKSLRDVMPTIFRGAPLKNPEQGI